MKDKELDAPEKPELREDIKNSLPIINWCEANGDRFRNYVRIAHVFDRTERIGARQALLAVLTPEQYAQLYHYGFVEEIGKSGDVYRIHWKLGNNVSVLVGGVADKGIDCFVYSETIDDSVLSNILAIRTNESRFLRVGCSAVPHERAEDPHYPRVSPVHRTASFLD